MRRRAFAILIPALLLPLFWIGSSRKPELVYEGKPVRQWLDGGFEDASRVLYEVGPPAANCVFEKLKREHPRYSRWGRYHAGWGKLPGFLRSVLPRPRPVSFDEWRARNALLAIGPRVIPVLAKALNDPDPLVRSVSAETLSDFHERGLPLEKAMPALKKALRDPDPVVSNTVAGLVLHPVSIQSP